MAIRFVDKTPAATETDPPADDPGQAPQEPAADPEAAGPPEGEPPRAPRRRKADAAPARAAPEGSGAGPEGSDAGPESGDAGPDAPGDPATVSAALPGFEDQPKPKRRRGAARPYWGFG